VNPNVGAGQTVVVLSPGGGHTLRLLPLIASLTKRGLAVHVMSRAEVRGPVEAAGGIFYDIFAKYPLEAADRESIPLPSRLVSFAAVYAEPLIAEVAALRPAFLVYDSFMVVAPLIGRRLGIPYVGMRAGHAQIPAQAIAEIRSDPRVSTSAACLAAVERLRRDYGMNEASPFSYLEGLSPHLNLYAEPARFLNEDGRRAFEPIAFFGSLAPELREAASRERPLAGHGRKIRVYAAFGSVIWRYYAAIALSAMAKLADVLAEYDAEVLFSLGNHSIDDADRRRIERPHIRVETYVDQWGALKDADLFVTHHGLKSTHEAIFHQVPMLSYPFFGDQPAMAQCCQDLGLAVPLSEAPRAALQADAVRRAIEKVRAQRAAFAARLAEARTWELEVIEGREAVVDRMLRLV
jgi:UDP:flavonoid glycosyltransferase YjiC (YdhE family)